MGVSQSGYGRSPKPAGSAGTILAIIAFTAALVWAATHNEVIPVGPQPKPTASFATVAPVPSR